jgi:PAS domain S-box-containing protein
MAQPDDTPRDLLLGLLALHNDLIDQTDLAAAFRDPLGRTVADALIAAGALTVPRRDLLVALTAEYLNRYGGDTERALAGLTAGSATRQRLAQLGDPELTADLARVGPTLARDADTDTDGTATAGVAGFGAGISMPVGQRFRVLRPLARGGLGEVSVAFDAELGREVALKRIRTDRYDDPSSRARFLLEGQVTGRLEHPGIVPVYSLGVDGSGRPFYAMRLIQGTTLKQAADRVHRADRQGGRDTGEGTLALRRLLGRFVDVCNAVAYAHSKGVIHRDLKPENVMLGPFGETLVVDWGLAKVVGRRATGAEDNASDATSQPAPDVPGETQPGTAVGTPAYMSPEQAAGRLDLVGPASDIYSLGAILYYIVTGRPPFSGTDLGRFLYEVQRGTFPRPGEIAGPIDPGLEAACLRAMSREPADRHASARALADEVELWLASDYLKLQEALEALKRADGAERADHMSCRLVPGAPFVPQQLARPERLSLVRRWLFRRAGSTHPHPTKKDFDNQVGTVPQPTPWYWSDTSAALEKFLGHTNDHLRGRPFFEFIHPEDRSLAESEFQAMVQAGERDDFVLRLRNGSGQMRKVQFTFQARYDQHMALHHIRCLLRDVTERVDAEEQLRRRAEQVIAGRDLLREGGDQKVEERQA